MDFTLSKQQQMVQKMYREFAENEVKPLAKKVDASLSVSLASSTLRRLDDSSLTLTIPPKPSSLTV